MFKFHNESGRSMVEMLGVLAIVGVLSIGGIAGYTAAMNTQRANDAVTHALRLATLASGKRLMSPTARLEPSELAGTNFTFANEDPDGFTLTISNLSPAVIAKINKMGVTVAKITVNGDSVIFAFKNDLGEGSTSGNCWQRGNCKETDVDPNYEQWCFDGVHSHGGFCSCAESAGPENCIEQDGTYPTCRAEGKSAAYCDCMKWIDNPTATQIAKCECIESGKSESCCSCMIEGGQPEANCSCT